MEAQWFYQDGGRKGPVDETQLLRGLLELPNPRLVKVWREGLSDWVDAALVPEIAGKLPPAMPGTSFSDRDRVVRVVEDSVEAVARDYRTLVLLVGLQILLGVLLQFVPVVELALAILLSLF